MHSNTNGTRGNLMQRGEPDKQFITSRQRRKILAGAAMPLPISSDAARTTSRTSFRQNSSEQMHPCEMFHDRNRTAKSESKLSTSNSPHARVPYKQAANFSANF